MSNGEPGLPSPDEFPPEQPPPYIEGMAGGPAMPTNVSVWSKDAAADYQQDMQVLTGLTATIGGMLMFVPGGFVLGIALGVVAVVAGLEVARMDDIVRDPLQPYERPVTFTRRKSRAPGGEDPIASRVGLIAQYGVAAMVTLQGLLDALERYEGARRAGAVDWAINHAAVGRVAARTVTMDLAHQGWAIASAARALSGSTHDIVIPADDISALKKVLGEAERVDHWRRACVEAGLTAREIDEGLTGLRAVTPLATSVRASEALDRVGRAIYTTAYEQLRR